MRIFLSHSREQGPLAARLATRLRADRHDVFHDVSSLERGDAFDRTIRERIAHSDLFLFLLSPASARPGSYARSELGQAERRWPNPALRVLPVMAVETPFDEIPSYLTAVTIFRPEGELVSDVVGEVATREQRLRRQRRTRLLAGVSGIAAGAVMLFGPGLRSISRQVTGEVDSGYRRAVTPEDGAARDVGAASGPVHQGTGQERMVTAQERMVLWRASDCVARIERSGSDHWLVCRCSGDRTVAPSLPLASASREGARSAARRVKWQCP